jgi:hypothetical protein
MSSCQIGYASTFTPFRPLSKDWNQGFLTKSNTNTTLMNVIMGSRYLLGLLHNSDCKFNHVVIDPALAP